MSFWSALLARPAELSLLARFTVGCGVFYLVVGGAVYVLPEAAFEFALQQDLTTSEVGSTHLLGMTIAIIGWFYVFGGRTGADSFGLSSVIDRLLVPMFVLPQVIFYDVPLLGVLPLAIADPLMGLCALWLWRRSRQSADHLPQAP